MKRESKAVTTVRILGLTAFLVFTIFPIAWMALTSFKPKKEIFLSPVRYLPSEATLQNYIELLQGSRMGTYPVAQYLKNSLIVSSATGFLTTFLSIFSGYALARFRFRGQRVVLIGFLSTQMIPLTVLLVPLFQVMSGLGLLDTLQGMIIIYTTLNLPFSTLLLRGFFAGVPPDIEDSALVDGCSKVGALFRVVLPVMLPGLAATFLFGFMGAWNELLLGVMFLRSRSKMTLPPGLNLLIGRWGSEWGILMAGGTLAFVPVIVAFALVQRYMIKGLTAGAVKG